MQQRIGFAAAPLAMQANVIRRLEVFKAMLGGPLDLHGAQELAIFSRQQAGADERGSGLHGYRSRLSLEKKLRRDAFRPRICTT
jgi:hypothetical protein